MEQTSAQESTGLINICRSGRKKRIGPLGRFIMYAATLVVRMLRFLLPGSHRTQVERITLKHPKVHKVNPKRSLRIVHLSDIHFDEPPYVPRVFPQELDEIVQLTNSFEPDLILLTGDYVQRRSRPAQELVDRWLSKLKSRDGVFAVLGNHDYKEGPAGRDVVIRALESAGIKVLMNESTTIHDGNVEIIGVGDMHYRPDYKPEKAFEKVNPDAPLKIVLSHNPDSAEHFRPYAVDLQLSGHTHGGQVKLPFGLGPALPYLESLTKKLPHPLNKLTPGRKHFRVVDHWAWAEGLHKIPRSGTASTEFNYLYTNRGIATHPPLRLLCPPEVAVIDIISSE